MTPQFSTGPESETLRFGYGDAALGTILVAESANGVIALFIGDERAPLLRELKDAFPEANLRLDETGLAQTIAKAVALVAAPQLGTDLRLDLRGSPIEVACGKRCGLFPPARRALTGRLHGTCR